jgi:flagellin-specific chaperone FliS
MFGKKAKEIKALRASVKYWEDCCRSAIERCAEAIEDLNARDQEVNSLARQLQASNELNEALNRENADLVYQLDLYRSVLNQLRVNVTLPARKK